MDFALIAQAATLESRVPFLHFFDGFRTSHEVNKIEQLDRRRPAGDDRRGRVVAPTAAAALVARPPGAARHRPEPRRLLPGPRGGQPVLPRRARRSCSETMDRFAGRDRPAVPPVRLRRRAGRRAGDRADGLGRGRGRGDGRGADRARARRSACVKVRLFRPFAAEAFVAALPPTVAAHRRARPHQGAGRASASRCTRTSSPPWPRPWPTGRRPPIPRVIGGRYGLSSKEFTPAMVKARLRRAGQARAEAPLHRRHRRRRHPHEPRRTTRRSRPSAPTPCGPCSTASAATARSAPTRTRSRSSARRPTTYAQGYFVYDSKKSGSMTISHLRFGPRPIRSHLPDRAGQLRRLPPVQLPRAHRRARGAPSPARPSCSTAPTARTRSGTTCRARCRSRSSTRSSRFYVDRRRRGGPRGGHGRPHQHHHADLLLRALAACCRATRRSPRSRRRSRRPTASAARPCVQQNFAAVDARPRRTCTR